MPHPTPMPLLERLTWVLLLLSGAALMAASPLLALGGALGGSDDGSGIYWGMAQTVALPWLFYIACFVASVLLLVRRRVRAACVPALLPPLAELWFYIKIH